MDISSAEAKVNYLVNSINKYGYDNVFFTDDAIKNVDAVREALDKIEDVDSRVKLAEISGIQLSESRKVVNPLDKEFNNIIEQKNWSRS